MAKKTTQEYNLLMKDLKSKKYKPVYFLAGEEPFFIDQISDYIEKHVLTEDMKEFNQQVIYGKETDAYTVVSEAMRYPMMSDRVVVIVKEAQNMKDLQPFENYVKNPSPTTILVVCHKYKKLDKRKSLPKALGKLGYLFESEKMYDSDLPEWINQHAKEQGYKISPRAAMLLSEYLGNDLSRIANELEKLTLNLAAGSEIDEQLVSKFTGISREYNNFELSNAIATRDLVKANKIVNYFEKDPKDNPLVVTLSILYGFFSKLMIFQLSDKQDKKALASTMGVNPYFMKEYETAARHYSADKTIRVIGYLREYDLKSKGVDNVSTSHGELLRELVFKITH